jgi:hypothetical protein
MISDIPIVMAVAVITAFVAMTIISAIFGYARDRESFERETGASSREFWFLLSLLVGIFLILLALFITLIWSLFA